MAQTLPYSIGFRTSSRLRKDGTTWKSDTLYIRFRVNGKLKYVDLETADIKVAATKAVQVYAEQTKDAKPAYSAHSLKSYLKKNNWFSLTENPLYKEYHTKLSNHSVGYYTAKKITTDFTYVFETLDDDLGRLPYNGITKQDVKAFKERLLLAKDAKQQPLKPSRINKIFASLSVLYDYIIANEQPDLPNLFGKKQLDRIKSEQKVERFVFQPKQIKRLLDDELLKMCYDVYMEIDLGEGQIRRYDYQWWVNFIDGPQYKMLCLMALSGLRLNEVSALTKGQFDKEYNRIVRINKAFKITPNQARMKAYLDGDTTYTVFDKPKSGEERTIVLCDKAYYIVKPLLDACEYDSDLIFVSKRGEGNYRNLYHYYYSGPMHNYRAFFEMFCNKFKIYVPENKKVSPHCLRTTLNTNLLKDDSPVVVKESWIASYMGWKTQTLSKTQAGSYTHYDIPQYRAVANAINVLYTGQEMLWNTFEEEKRDDSIELIEAQIRKENGERIQKLEVKGLLYKLSNKIANYDPDNDPKRLEERLSKGEADTTVLEDYIKNSNSLIKKGENELQGKKDKEPLELDEDIGKLLEHFEKLQKHLDKK